MATRECETVVEPPVEVHAVSSPGEPIPVTYFRSAPNSFNKEDLSLLVTAEP